MKNSALLETGLMSNSNRNCKIKTSDRIKPMSSIGQLMFTVKQQRAGARASDSHDFCVFAVWTRGEELHSGYQFPNTATLCSNAATARLHSRPSQAHTC